MTRRGISILLALGALTLPVASARALDLGDEAPELAIEEWVNSDPINIAEGKGKKAYLVEFWATWCPPCKVSIPRLSEMQDKYEGKLAIIGVTAPNNSDNSAAAVRKFVRRQGDEMRYAVALDKDNKTTDRYMVASGAMGIPHAFLVGLDGKIAWVGSPLDPVLEGVIDQVVSGDYDVTAAKVQAQVESRLGVAYRMLQTGRTNDAWRELTEILRLDPSNKLVIDIIVRFYEDTMNERDKFRGWAEAHIADHRDNRKAMVRLADALCHISSFSLRVPDLALEAAQAGYGNGADQDALALAAYAGAMFQIGKVDRAVKLQTDAVAMASESQREQMQSVLDYYHSVKRLNASVE